MYLRRMKGITLAMSCSTEARVAMLLARLLEVLRQDPGLVHTEIF